MRLAFSVAVLCLLLSFAAHADTSEGKIAICRRPYITGHQNQDFTIRAGSRFAEDLGSHIGWVVATQKDAELTHDKNCVWVVATIVQRNGIRAFGLREKLLQQYAAGAGEAPPDLDAFAVSGFGLQ